MLVLAFLLAADSPGCAAFAVSMTPTLRGMEARRITALSRQTVTPSGISYVLADRRWRLVFATPRKAERGVFILRRMKSSYRLIDTWGGILPPDERGQAAEWARGLKGGGVSPDLAACMDQAIVSGR
jgi:hypothetical protein